MNNESAHVQRHTVDTNFWRETYNYSNKTLIKNSRIYECLYVLHSQVQFLDQPVLIPGHHILMLFHAPFLPHPDAQGTLSPADMLNLPWCTTGPLASVADMLSLPFSVFGPVHLILTYISWDNLRQKTLVL